MQDGLTVYANPMATAYYGDSPAKQPAGSPNQGRSGASKGAAEAAKPATQPLPAAPLLLSTPSTSQDFEALLQQSDSDVPVFEYTVELDRQLRKK